LNVSVTDLKKNYDNLNVHFDLWKGESDAQPYIPDMVQMMKDKGYAYMSEGALVVDVKEETDAKEVPPCIILKSDGASLYSTTDLATIVMRMQDYDPDTIIYVTDQRQSMHFVQVFRCARKTGLVGPEVELKHIGFGTMNGKDGKPFKTRDGGVLRLEYLLDEINEKMLEKIRENQKEKENLSIPEDEVRQTAKTVALAAIKYADLSNQASKDYIFDIDRFTSFEGNTGPYILYTIVRIKSILKKYEEAGKSLPTGALLGAHAASEKSLMLVLSRFNAMMENAYEETAPHKICAYIYELANAFNSFYHETKILSEEDEGVQQSYIGLLMLTKSVLESAIDVLGFSAPDRM
jgi:arginyl-tRNA synthetase